MKCPDEFPHFSDDSRSPLWSWLRRILYVLNVFFIFFVIVHVLISGPCPIGSVSPGCRLVVGTQPMRSVIYHRMCVNVGRYEEYCGRGVQYGNCRGVEEFGVVGALEGGGGWNPSLAFISSSGLCENRLLPIQKIGSRKKRACLKCSILAFFNVTFSCNVLFHNKPI